MGGGAQGWAPAAHHLVRGHTPGHCDTPPPRLAPLRHLTWAQGSPTTLLSLSWSQLGRMHFHEHLNSFSFPRSWTPISALSVACPWAVSPPQALHGHPIVRSASWRLQTKNRKHERHFPHHKFLFLTGSHQASVFLREQVCLWLSENTNHTPQGFLFCWVVRKLTKWGPSLKNQLISRDRDVSSLLLFGALALCFTKPVS